MANLIDFEDPERLRVYESLSDFHKLKNSLMFRLYQEHVSNINSPSCTYYIDPENSSILYCKHRQHLGLESFVWDSGGKLDFINISS